MSNGFTVTIVDNLDGTKVSHSLSYQDLTLIDSLLHTAYAFNPRVKNKNVQRVKETISNFCYGEKK